MYHLLFFAISGVLLVCIRYVKKNRELVVLNVQLMNCFLANGIVYLKVGKDMETVTLVAFSLFTFWISLFLLEVWAMTNDGYTALILVLLQKERNKCEFTRLGQIINERKSKDRIHSLFKLRMITINDSVINITNRGIIVLRVIKLMRKILFLKEREF